MRDQEYSAMFELEERLWWYEGMRAITASILGPALIEEKHRRLVEVGCGTGYAMTWLRDRLGIGEVYGVDLSQHAAAFWNTRALGTAALASVDALPVGECGVD